MSKKSKIDPALKVELVERYLKGEISIYEAVRLAGMSGKTSSPMRKWVLIYQNEGPTGLFPRKKNNYYQREEKIAAVNEYLNGERTAMEIVKKFGLRSDSQLYEWVKMYNTHGDIKCRGSGGGSYMSKSRQTTLEERLKIVQDCLSNNKNYGAINYKIKIHTFYQIIMHIFYQDFVSLSPYKRFWRRYDFPLMVTTVA